VSFGLWPGDANIREAAYYAYVAPEPDGLTDEALPEGARWAESGTGHLALLPYETVSTRAGTAGCACWSSCRSRTKRGARRASWDTADLASSTCPTPAVLQEPARAPARRTRSHGGRGCEVQRSRGREPSNRTEVAQPRAAGDRPGGHDAQRSASTNRN